MNAVLRRNDSRRLLLFLAVAASVVGAWLWLLRGTFYRDHPAVAEIGAAIDLLIMVPLMFWLVMGRRVSVIRKELVVICLLAIGVTLVIVPGATRSVEAWIWMVELVLIAGVVLRLRSAVSESDIDQPLAARVREITREMIPFGPAADAIATEISLFAYVFSKRSALVKPPQFRWTDTEGWTGIVIGLCVAVVAESIGIHLWLHQSRPVLSWIILALDLYGILWLIGDARAFGVSGVNMRDGALEIDFGLRWRGVVPLAKIERVGRFIEGQDLDLKLALVEAPEVLLTLRERVSFVAIYGIRKRVRTIGLRVENREELIDTLIQSGVMLTEPPASTEPESTKAVATKSPPTDERHVRMTYDQWLKSRPDYIPLEDWLRSKPSWVE